MTVRRALLIVALALLAAYAAAVQLAGDRVAPSEHPATSTTRPPHAQPGNGPGTPSTTAALPVLTPELFTFEPPPAPPARPDPIPHHMARVGGPRVWADDELVAIARCEQPGAGFGGVAWNHPGPTYQGGPGFYSATWLDNRPAGAPDNAGLATVDQQLTAMRTVLARYPDAWAAARRCAGVG